MTFHPVILIHFDTVLKPAHRQLQLACPQVYRQLLRDSKSTGFYESDNTVQDNRTKTTTANHGPPW